MANRTDEFAQSALTHDSTGRNGYKASSVYEAQNRRKTIGYGESDQERLLPDGTVLKSRNGMSDQTYEDKLWLHQ